MSKVENNSCVYQNLIIMYSKQLEWDETKLQIHFFYPHVLYYIFVLAFLKFPDVLIPKRTVYIQSVLKHAFTSVRASDENSNVHFSDTNIPFSFDAFHGCGWIGFRSQLTPYKMNYTQLKMIETSHFPHKPNERDWLAHKVIFIVREYVVEISNNFADIMARRRTIELCANSPETNR